MVEQKKQIFGAAVVAVVDAHNEIKQYLDDLRASHRPDAETVLVVTRGDLQNWHDAICKIPMLMTVLMASLMTSEENSGLERLATINDAPLH